VTPFIVIAVVFLVVAAAIGSVYSRQRRSDTYDLEGTRKAASGGTGNGVSAAGTGAGGGN
jgi:hypothetical protein